MQSSNKPQLKWHGWVVGGALLLATLNCAVAQVASLAGPPDGRGVVYWPYLWTTALWWLWAPWSLAGMLIVAALYYATPRLHATKPVRQATAGLVLGGTLLAAVVIVCSFSLMFVGGYRHLTSMRIDHHRYFLGYDATDDMAGDYVICGCDTLGWACRCHYIRNPGYDPFFQDLRLIPIPNGGVQFYRGDDLLYTWPGDEP